MNLVTSNLLRRSIVVNNSARMTDRSRPKGCVQSHVNSLIFGK